MGDIIRQVDFYIIGIMGGKERLFKEIMNKNFTTLGKHRSIRLHNAQ